MDSLVDTRTRDAALLFVSLERGERPPKWRDLAVYVRYAVLSEYVRYARSPMILEDVVMHTKMRVLEQYIVEGD